MPDKKTILVVDDTPDNIDVLSGLLAGEYRVLAATSANAALMLLKNVKPDAILLDILMPEMDGYELLDILKQDKSTRDIPVLLISSLAQHEFVERGLSLGAAGSLGKPVDPLELRESVRRIVIG